LLLLRRSSLRLRRLLLGLHLSRRRCEREGHVGKKVSVSGGRGSRRAGRGRAGSIGRSRHRCLSARRCLDLHQRAKRRVRRWRHAAGPRDLGWRDLGLLLWRGAGGPNGRDGGHGRPGHVLAILGIRGRFWVGGRCHLGRRATKSHVRERGNGPAGLIPRLRRPRQASKGLLFHFGRLQVDDHGCWGSHWLLLCGGRLALRSQLVEVSLEDRLGRQLRDVSLDVVIMAVSGRLTKSHSISSRITLNLSTAAGIRVSMAAAAAVGFPLPSRLAALNALAVVTSFGESR
jgi:hypothetical protein